MSDGPESVQPTSTATGATGPSKRTRSLIVGIAALGAVLYGAYAIHQETEQFDKADKAEAGIPPVGAGATWDQPNNSGDAHGHVSKSELLSPNSTTDVTNIPTAELVGAFGDDFDNWRGRVYNLIAPQLSADQASILNERSIPSGPKEAWSDQMILNSLALDIADATVQDSAKEGRAMLPAVLDPHSNSFREVFNTIQGGERPAPTVAVYAANGQPYPKPNGSFMNTSNLSPNARLIYGTYKQNGTGNDTAAMPAVAILVDLIKSPDGKSSLWHKYAFWNPNDPEFIVAYVQPH